MGWGIAVAVAISLQWLRMGAEGHSIKWRCLHLDVWRKMKLISACDGRGLLIATQGCWVGSRKGDQLHETQSVLKLQSCCLPLFVQGLETLPKRVQDSTQSSPPWLLDRSWLLKWRLQNVIKCLYLGLLALTARILPCWLTPSGVMTTANRSNNKDSCIVCIHHGRRWRLYQETRGRSRKEERGDAAWRPRTRWPNEPTDCIWSPLPFKSLQPQFGCNNNQSILVTFGRWLPRYSMQ